MRMEVINDYVFDNPNPIELIIGDTVRLGEKTDPNGPYPNWIFCTSERTGRTGWVAENILSIKDGAGVAAQDYTAKEMSVAAGEIVDAMYELNGWYWCARVKDADEGWVAKDNLRLP